MAKIKLQGHASGSGIITLTAPNTSTDRTITLPDGDVTLGAATPSIVDGGNATAITIDSAENVGVGVTPAMASSSYNGLHIGATYPTMKLSSTATGHAATDGFHLRIDSTPRVEHWNYENSSQVFATNNAARLEITADGRGLSQFTAKAWVNFDQTGTTAVNDSHNVSGLTDIGTGRTQITFANAMGNNNYCQVNGIGDYERIYNEGAALATKHTNSRKSTASTYIDLATGTNATDFDEVNILVFGD